MVRTLASCAAIALLVGLAPRAHAGSGEDGDDDGAAAEAASAPRPAAVHAGHAHRRHARRRHKARFFGHVVPDDQLRAEPLPRPSGDLAVVSVNHPDDKASVNIFNPDGSYNLEALAEVDYVLRCQRTLVEKEIDPQLLSLLSIIYDHFGRRPLEIVSGFRNQRKQTSNHFKGRASDIRIAGVTPNKIQEFAETLDRGGMGIGIYPKGHFVHIDVRSPPSYRWIDYSPPNPNAPEKRPPRGWKRKKLQS
jgi:uncharacterized protein YcbK (DUF882 family)